MNQRLAALVLSSLCGWACAVDIAAQARAEYRRCLIETRQASRDCTGGCGNILGYCYQRQIGVFEGDTQRIADRLGQGACAAAQAEVEASFTDFGERLLKICQFDSTWSGQDLQVGLAKLKNDAMRKLSDECGR